MGQTDAFAQPSFPKVLVSFVVGLIVGFAMALPAIPDSVTRVSLGDLGPVGDVLLFGVLSIVVVTTGMFGLYRLFWLVDK